MNAVQTLVRVLSLAGATLWAGSSADVCIGEEVDYNFDIKPILSDRCFICHGPDANQRQADLRLDDRDVAVTEREVIVPGEPDDSTVVDRITSDDPDERMPPPASKLPPLSADEVNKIRRWIEQGAEWKKHWSFIPPAQPNAPPSDPKSLRHAEIDRLVREKLVTAGLQPSSEAAKEQLIRRIAFDLTGLPPTRTEVAAFVADQTPEAYEKVVDRLLASPRYGERMAVDWLDLARYSDTYGYQVDRDRRVWPWRDWVIGALNDDMPYDQFLTEQLAGDLLPNATDEQRLATAFNRLHPQKSEGGSTEAEFRTEYVADRTHTFGTAFLGLTLQCARCHDHKYDPVTQKEYFQLFAFFNNIDEFGLYSYHTTATPTPTLLLTDESTQRAIDEAENKIERAVDEIASKKPSRRDAFEAWLSDRGSGSSIPDLAAHFSFDAITDGKIANAADADAPATSTNANTIVAGKIGQAIKLTGDDGVQTTLGNFTRNEPFSVTLWIQAPDVKDRAVLFHRSRSWTDAGSRGYQLLIEEGRLSASLIHFWPGNAIRVRTRDPIPVGEWIHVGVTYDGSSRAIGLQIYVNGEPADRYVVRDVLSKNITGGGGDTITIGERNRDRGFKGGLVDELYVVARELTPIEVAQIHDRHSLDDLLAKPADSLSPAERDALFEYFLSTVDAEHKQRLADLRDARKARSAIVDPVAEIMVMQEKEGIRTTHLLDRGAYDAPGEAVSASTPDALPSFPEGERANRLGLARWLTDPDHPLTARVVVNRFWQMFFGQGLVRTSEDFGSQGELPSHPELLDFLARDFIDSGWDVKRFLKQIAMSATYRQSSRARAELHEIDPDNRLLARGPRFRLPAEMIRDNALVTSGLLVEKLGGPPVTPYELTEAFKPRKRAEGEGLYRRSLYTFWQRTGPAPVMMALDAAKRDVCVVRRERTSTPLQVLVLLNDPQFVEAARMIGQQMILDHGDDTNRIVESVFETLTSRRPTAAERDVLLALYQEQLEHFQGHPELADEFLKVGDAARDESLDPARLAAVAVLVEALFNHDACVTKR